MIIRAPVIGWRCLIAGPMKRKAGHDYAYSNLY